MWCFKCNCMNLKDAYNFVCVLVRYENDLQKELRSYCLASVKVIQEVKHTIFEVDRKINMISVIYEETFRNSQRSVGGAGLFWVCFYTSNIQKPPAFICKQRGLQYWVEHQWATAPIMLHNTLWFHTKTLRMIWEMAPSCFSPWIHEWVYHTLVSLTLTKPLIFA